MWPKSENVCIQNCKVFYVDILLFDGEIQQFAVIVKENGFWNDRWRTLFQLKKCTLVEL